MTNNKPILLGAQLCLSLCLFLSSAAAWAQARPDFSGLWRQDNDSSHPKRSGDVTLRIEQRDPELTVKTSILRSSGSARQTLQTYTTDGNISISKGADGDEFQTSVVWKEASLLFSIEEHEDGRILRSQEIWSLTDNGATLLRRRERVGEEKQIIVYRRPL